MPPSSLSKNGGRNQEEPFHVGFETPVVIDVQDPALLSSGGNNSGSDGGGRLGREGEGGGMGGRPTKLRWVPPSLATRSNAGRLRSLSPGSDMADLDPEDRLQEASRSHPQLQAHPHVPSHGHLGAESGLGIHMSSTENMGMGMPPHMGIGSNMSHEGISPGGHTHMNMNVNMSMRMNMSMGANMNMDVGPDPALFSSRTPGLRIAPNPLPPVGPDENEVSGSRDYGPRSGTSNDAGDLHARFDERNSYAEAGTYPYHPDQVSVNNHHF